jgi:hypothetical protein
MNFHDLAIFQVMTVAKRPRRNNESSRRKELLRGSARLFLRDMPQ